jgi:excisionase family DNA binding protein
MVSVYVRPKEAATRLQISVSTVYRRIRKGLLKSKRDGGRIKVEVRSTHAPEAPNQPEEPVRQKPKPVVTPPSSEGQRALIIRPGEGARVAFFQVPTWR